MTNYVLEMQSVSKTYGQDQTRYIALQDIDLKLTEKSLNLIVGPSGSGKSTLINLASLLDTPSQGKILIKEQNLSNLGETDRSKFRRREIGIIYQRNNLFTFLNILENVMTPMLLKDRNKAQKLLNKMGIYDLKKFPEELSILDQQKITLSRALINEPCLLLADEPTGELNTHDQGQIMNLFQELSKEITIILVSNNQDLMKYCDNIYNLQDGFLKKKL
jgi:putative ABC transport system ATP-binding protein